MLSEGAASQPVTLAGEQLIARADGSLFWPSESALFVADLHFGKAATFRSAAVAVPVGTSASMFRRLSATLNETGARRLYFLGDLWHAKEGRKSEILQSFEDWRRAYKGVEMVLVEGNHDRRSGKLPTVLEIETVTEPLLVGPFALCHYPTEISNAYCLAGHIHPAVSLSGPGRQSLRLPCFWFGKGVGVLPAFGDFTGLATIEPRAGDQIFAIAGGELHSIRVE